MNNNNRGKQNMKSNNVSQCLSCQYSVLTHESQSTFVFLGSHSKPLDRSLTLYVHCEGSLDLALLHMY